MPEVMVKITGGGRNRGAVEAHLGYIGRHGKVEVEDQDGQVYLGKDDLLVSGAEPRASGGAADRLVELMTASQRAVISASSEHDAAARP